MPWNKIEDVPDNVRTHKGVKLTLPQANHWARIYDATGNAAIAWSQFVDIYKIEGDKWVGRKNKMFEVFRQLKYDLFGF